MAAARLRVWLRDCCVLPLLARGRGLRAGVAETWCFKVGSSLMSDISIPNRCCSAVFIHSVISTHPRPLKQPAQPVSRRSMHSLCAR